MSRLARRALPLQWSRRSQRDLHEVGQFIAKDDRRAAGAWVEKLVEAAGRAAAHPLSGRMVPELGREDIREVLVGTYRVVYRVHKTHVFVLTVFEGHRRLPEGSGG